MKKGNSTKKNTNFIRDEELEDYTVLVFFVLKNKKTLTADLISCIFGYTLSFVFFPDLVGNLKIVLDPLI